MTEPPLLDEGIQVTLTFDPEIEVITLEGWPGTDAAIIDNDGE